jgi:uncharacterized protein YcnI
MLRSSTLDTGMPDAGMRDTARPRSTARIAVRIASVIITAGALALVGAAPAFAHVSPQPGTAAQGSETVVSLRVPDESDTAGTIALTVTLPTDHPITSVATTPIPGWTATTTKIPLNPPVQNDGQTLTETVGSVAWKANPGTRIAPGQYLDFPLSLALPTGVDKVLLPATQTYDNGEVVNWNQPPNPDGSEPDHPVPTLTLTPATSPDAPLTASAAQNGAATSTSTMTANGTDTTARWLGGAGLLVGALGLGVGAGALLRQRRRRVD